MIEWLEASAYADWVRESWGWPIALSVHAFGVATVIGVMVVIGLRLLGAFRAIPFALLGKLIPLLWLALLAQVLSGLTLWMSKPGKYLADFMFDFKMGWLALGVLLTIWFQVVLNREAPAWDKAGTASFDGKLLVGGTALVWAAVTIFGRLTAYLSTLYIA